MENRGLKRRKIGLEMENIKGDSEIKEREGFVRDSLGEV